MAFRVFLTNPVKFFKSLNKHARKATRVSETDSVSDEINLMDFCAMQFGRLNEIKNLNRLSDYDKTRRRTQLGWPEH